jgi:hypothetical protein
LLEWKWGDEMLIPGKFVFGCLGFGVASFLGTSLLQVPAIGHASLGQGSSSTAGNALQTAIDQAGSVYREASADVAPKLRSFADAGSTFVSSNATTARLQFEGMQSSVAAHLSIDAWVPDDAPYWVRGGVQVAAQATGSQAIVLAGKNPVVRALKSNLERLAGAHPSISLAP